MHEAARYARGGQACMRQRRAAVDTLSALNFLADHASHPAAKLWPESINHVRNVPGAARMPVAMA